jgi:DNA polymerase I
MAKRSYQRQLAGFDDPADAGPEASPGPEITPAGGLESAPPTAAADPPREPTAAPSAPVPSGPAAYDRSASSEPATYLIDAHSLIYQVFHALPEMSGPSGQPVGAVHGFVRDVLDLIEMHHADRIVAAFDHPGKNFRHDLYEPYKANRDEMPPDLALQIPMIQRFLVALGVPLLSIAGYEADDILATLARQVEKEGGLAYLVTSDKDCRQLLSERIKILNLRKREVFDAASLLKTWGIRPDQVVDFQSLVGDKVDNVPGIPLIGEKSAQELLAKYETLEGIFAHAHEISGAKRKENVISGQGTALASRELVRLATDVPLEIDWTSAHIGGMQVDVLEALCRECGFRQLARRIELLARKRGGAATAADRGSDLALASADSPGTELSSLDDESLAGSSEPLPELTTAASPEWNAKYTTIATREALAELVDKARQQSRVVVDTETTSVQPRWAEIVGYSLCWQPGEAYYIPVRAPADEPQLDPAMALEALRPLLEDPTVRKIGQNLKYDLVVLRSAGVELRGEMFDTMVADFLLEPGERSHNMDDMARRFLRHQTITIDQLIGTGKKQRRMDEVPVALVTDYAAEDADVPLRIADLVAPRLAAEGMQQLFDELEMPLVAVLAEMEFNGIRVDVARLRELSGQFNDRIMRLEREIFEIAGREFNIDSRIQLGQLLFDELKLPVMKKTKTGPSMDAEVLEDLAPLHPLPAKVIEYRQNTKLKSTYVDALQELVHPTTGRVHTSFKQDVAATGRLSSQDPNLQNIPIRTEQGREIRSAFLPGPEGWLLLAADYSQIELRVLAHFSGDATLRQAFADDRDIHAQVASEVYGVPLEEVSSAQRRNAKAVNFGVIYGQSPFGLAKGLGISKSEAAEFIERYFARYPGVDRFILDTLRSCRRDGYVSTIFGRRRPVSGVRNVDLLRDKRQRTLPERIAVNTVIQGSAADIIKRAMIQIHRRLGQEQLAAKLLLQIHDELVFEFPPEEESRLRTLVVEEMEQAVELAVPLKVDVAVGATWAACE